MQQSGVVAAGATPSEGPVGVVLCMAGTAEAVCLTMYRSAYDPRRWPAGRLYLACREGSASAASAAIAEGARFEELRTRKRET